ncbi:MAG: mycothiol maleylpyruvate isomerase [Nocardioidaceae bacterium]|nr:mycothiol maleylpyruvate isomerase [Nocardioidaceae bacterium]NUS49482.1 mycothiol maleylpyruvate isomerase [Nocardioidaceae bacterium]
MPGRETYVGAARSFADLVARLPADAYDGPGLGAWDLRALVGHASRSVVTVLEYLDRPGRAEDVVVPDAEGYYAAVVATLGDPAQAQAVVERGRAAGEALGDDPAGHVAALVDEVTAKLAGFDDDYVLTTIAGPMRLRDYLPTRTFELVVHGLDVARATGLRPGFGDDATAEAVTLAARTAVRTGLAEDLLLAVTGRTGLPDGFSVV